MNAFSFDVYVVILTPGISETCLNDITFAKKSLLKYTFNGNNSQLASSLHVTDLPFVNTYNTSSVQQVLILVTKSGLLKTV